MSDDASELLKKTSKIRTPETAKAHYKLRACYLPLFLLCVCGVIGGCSDDNNTTTNNTTTDMPADVDINEDMSPDMPDAGTQDDVCAGVTVAEFYDDAGTVGTCTSEAGKRIADSMMNLSGITIDNSGEEMTPCLRVVCDNNHAYIIANNLPHYDFVVLTPNALVESLGVHRIPLVPSAPKGTDPVEVTTLNGCAGMYESYTEGTVPTSEPSGNCTAGETGYLTENTASGTKTYAQIGCLSQLAVFTNGVMANGPNEADRGVWGDPGLEPVNEPAQGPGASVDYCGGHTGRSMHYHSANEACFEKDEQNRPALSYAVVGTTWDQKTLIDGDCTEPSGIIGWSLDGYPIKGPCVCTERDADGSCASVKRARTSWLYRGIKAHSPSPNTALEIEGTACEETADCCATQPCDFACNNVVTDGDEAGSGVKKVCAFLRHAWCTREHVNMDAQDTSAQNFVYLDRCNGYDSPDGFAYHAIGTFPYLQSCFRGEPAEQAGTDGPGGPPDGPGGPGGPPGGM